MSSAAEATLIPTAPNVDDERKMQIASAAADDPRPSTPDPMAQELFTFDVSVTEASGKAWEGTFTNRILTIPERAEVGVLAARLAGSLPWESIDPDTAYLLRAQAHLTISLDPEKGGARPRWFLLSGKDSIRNPRVINAIYAEVSAHEGYFCGPPTSKKSSESGD